MDHKELSHTLAELYLAEAYQFNQQRLEALTETLKHWDRALDLHASQVPFIDRVEVYHARLKRELANIISHYAECQKTLERKSYLSDMERASTTLEKDRLFKRIRYFRDSIGSLENHHKFNYDSSIEILNQHLTKEIIYEETQAEKCDQNAHILEAQMRFYIKKAKDFVGGTNFFDLQQFLPMYFEDLKEFL